MMNVLLLQCRPLTALTFHVVNIWLSVETTHFDFWSTHRLVPSRVVWGRGTPRPASLPSLTATAPLLHTLGQNTGNSESSIVACTHPSRHSSCRGGRCTPDLGHFTLESGETRLRWTGGGLFCCFFFPWVTLYMFYRKSDVFFKL